MTISIQIGELETQTKKRDLFGYAELKIKLQVTWHSCGCYAIWVEKMESLDNKYIEPKTGFSLHMNPEHLEKVAEMFPNAPVRPRMETHKPFYEDYDPDRGMFDFGHDTLFQAFKDPLENNRVIIANINFNGGIPSSLDSLSLDFDEFKKLKTLIDDKKGEIFYSGVKCSFS